MGISWYRQHKPQWLIAPLAGVIDADARCAPDRAKADLVAAILDPQTARRFGRRAIDPLVDRQLAAELARSTVFACRPEQHRLRRAFFAGHDIEHPVHAVDEVHVPV